jgi:hypothetical protein
MSAPYTGGCACCAIRYEVAAEPLWADHCQCRDCQRMTGGGHASMTAFPEAALRLTGTPRSHSVTADSRQTASRGFCPTCGPFLLWRSSGMPGTVEIAADSLDDPSLFTPQLVVYTHSAQAWDHTSTQRCPASRSCRRWSAVPPDRRSGWCVPLADLLATRGVGSPLVAPSSLQDRARPARLRRARRSRS